MDDRLPITEKHNIIVDVVNETLVHCAGKISGLFGLIKKHNRVPDLMGILEEQRKEDKKHNLKNNLRDAVDGILGCLEKKGQANENK